MKPITKDILLEIIQFSEKQETKTNFLKEAIKQMGGFGEVYPYLIRIISWTDNRQSILPDYDSEKLSIHNEGTDNKHFTERMKNLFRLCPELNEIYLLTEKFIKFNPKLTKKDIEELKEFVDNNRRKRITSYYIPAKSRK